MVSVPVAAQLRIATDYQGTKVADAAEEEEMPYRPDIFYVCMRKSLYAEIYV